MYTPNDPDKFFSVLMTGFLANLLKNQGKVDHRLRVWLSNNNQYLNQRDFQLLCSLGIKRKSFLTNLKEWLKLVCDRQRNVSLCSNNELSEWISMVNHIADSKGIIFVRERHLEEEAPSEWVKKVKNGIIVCDDTPDLTTSFYAKFKLIGQSPNVIRELKTILFMCGLEGAYVKIEDSGQVFCFQSQDPEKNNFNIYLKDTESPLTCLRALSIQS